MPDQPHPPEYIMDLAAGPPGGPEEARLSEEERAEVEEQRAVRQMLSSLPDPQLTPEEQRDLRRAVHAAAEESARAAPALPAPRRFRWSRAWPALAAAASLAVVAAVALNLRDIGDTVAERAVVTAAPATTAAVTPAPTTTAAATTTTMAAFAGDDMATDSSETAAGGITEAMAEESTPEGAPPTDAAPEPAPASTAAPAAAPESVEAQPSLSRSLEEGLPRLWKGDDGYSEEELAVRAREAAAGQPDVFPLPYSELGEYAARAELACWDHFATGTDDDRTMVLFAGRAWIGEYWYETYHVETDYPDEGLRETFVAFTPPGALAGTVTENNPADADVCAPLYITEH